jgi:hypothetical protein
MPWSHHIVCYAIIICFDNLLTNYIFSYDCYCDWVTPLPHCTLLRFLILKLFFDTIPNPVRNVVDSLAYLWEQVCYSFLTGSI